MHIDVEHGSNYAILHLRGEFDTYYVRHLQREVDVLIESGVIHIVLNLRLVKFINSTALGAIIKASRTLTAEGGRLVLSRPSNFCRDVIDKIGLGSIAPIFDSDEKAVEGLFSDAEPTAQGPRESFEVDESSVLFSPVDPARIEHFLSDSQVSGGAQPNPVHGHAFGGNWRGVGRMSHLDENGVKFTWSGGNTGMEPFAMGQLLALGTDLAIKFRLPLFKKGWSEAVASVTDVEERDDGVKIGASFKDIDSDTLAEIAQYASDLKTLRDEGRPDDGG